MTFQLELLGRPACRSAGTTATAPASASCAATARGDGALVRRRPLLRLPRRQRPRGRGRAGSCWTRARYGAADVDRDVAAGRCAARPRPVRPPRRRRDRPRADAPLDARPGHRRGHRGARSTTAASSSPTLDDRLGRPCRNRYRLHAARTRGEDVAVVKYDTETGDVDRARAGTGRGAGEAVFVACHRTGPRRGRRLADGDRHHAATAARRSCWSWTRPTSPRRRSRSVRPPARRPGGLPRLVDQRSPMIRSNVLPRASRGLVVVVSAPSRHRAGRMPL